MCVLSILRFVQTIAATVLTAAWSLSKNCSCNRFKYIYWICLQGSTSVSVEHGLTSGGTNLPTPEADKQTAETIGHVLDMCDLCDMWLLHWKQRCRTICLIWHSPLQLIASRNGLELFYRFGFLILKRLTLRVFCCQQVYSGREGIKAESINSHSRQNIWSVRSSLSLA